METNDHALWAEVLDGNGRAFGEVFERHRDRVFRALARSVAISWEAEDLTAIVFLELWRKLRSVRFVGGSLLPWLLVTAGNVARNSSRGRRRYATFLASLPLPELQADFTSDVDSSADSAREKRSLQEALRALSAIDRDLIALTSLEDYSLAEAAMAVGISYGAAKTRLSRARQKLHKALTDLTPTEGL